MLTPAERSQRARIAAHTLHAHTDSRRLTEPARRAADQRFHDEVDPDGTLDPEERERRVRHARKAYFTNLALKSAIARRKNAEARAEADSWMQGEGSA